jgi:hypothetical protein
VRPLRRRGTRCCRRARRRKTPRRQGAPASPRRAALHLPLPSMRRAHHASLPACTLRAFQGHLRVAGVVRVPEILVAHAARSHPS